MSVRGKILGAAAGALGLLLGENGRELIGWTADASQPRHKLVTPRLIRRTLAAFSATRL